MKTAIKFFSSIPLKESPSNCSMLVGHAADLAIDLGMSENAFNKLLVSVNEKRLLAFIELLHLHNRYDMFKGIRIEDYYRRIIRGDNLHIFVKKVFEECGVKFKARALEPSTFVNIEGNIINGFRYPVFYCGYRNKKQLRSRKPAGIISIKQDKVITQLRYARHLMNETWDYYKAIQILYKQLHSVCPIDSFPNKELVSCTSDEYNNVLYELRTLFSDIEYFYIKNKTLPCNLENKLTLYFYSMEDLFYRE